MDLKYKLPRDYTIHEIPTEKFWQIWQKPAKEIFNDKSLMYDGKDVHSKKELNQFKKLRELFNSQNHLRINLGLFYKNKFVGWSWGFQETATTFYMIAYGFLNRTQEL